MRHPHKANTLLCDWCGTEIPFTSDVLQYYSINFKKIAITMSAKLNKTDVDDSLDLDICNNCYDTIFVKVKEINIKNNAIKKAK